MKSWRPPTDRLEIHRLRSGSPLVGPIFANAMGKPLSLGSLVNRVIVPALNRCEACGKAEANHHKVDHPYRRDTRIPEWHGWHAARRAMTKLENHIAETGRIQSDTNGTLDSAVNVEPSTIQ